MAEYNGCPNQETHGIALVIENEESYEKEIIDIVKRCYGDEDKVAKALRNWIEDEVYNLLSAPTIWPLGKQIIEVLLDMSMIDWDYLAQSYIEAYAEVDETEDMTD